MIACLSWLAILALPGSFTRAAQGDEYATFSLPPAYEGVKAEWWLRIKVKGKKASKWMQKGQRSHLEGFFPLGRISVKAIVTTQNHDNLLFGGNFKIAPSQKNHFVLQLSPGRRDLPKVDRSAVTKLKTPLPRERQGPGFSPIPKPKKRPISLKAADPKGKPVLSSGTFNCEGPEHCPIIHAPTGLNVTLPAGWALEDAFFYKSPNGSISEIVTAYFSRKNGSREERFELNPLVWKRKEAKCEVTSHGNLCFHKESQEQTLKAFDIIRKSLR